MDIDYGLRPREVLRHSINHERLLEKYIKLVVASEGVDYITSGRSSDRADWANFTSNEIEELKRLSRYG